MAGDLDTQLARLAMSIADSLTPQRLGDQRVRHTLRERFRSPQATLLPGA